jgi:hypothetical protein
MVGRDQQLRRDSRSARTHLQSLIYFNPDRAAREREKSHPDRQIDELDAIGWRSVAQRVRKLRPRPRRIDD